MFGICEFGQLPYQKEKGKSEFFFLSFLYTFFFFEIISQLNFYATERRKTLHKLTLVMYSGSNGCEMPC